MNYHDRPELSASQLKCMASGWRQYEWEYVMGNRRQPTDAMRLGSAVHAAVLEPSQYWLDYAVIPKDCGDKRTKAYKEWAAENEGTIHLPAAEADKIAAIADAVFSDPVASLFIRGAEVEQEVYWTHHSGQECRAKIDILRGAVIADIKTCQDARQTPFGYDVRDRHYALQAVHYMEGTGATKFVFIAVETSPPHRVRCYELDSQTLDDAKLYREELIHEYRRRSVSGDWSEDGEGSLAVLFPPKMRV